MTAPTLSSTSSRTNPPQRASGIKQQLASFSGTFHQAALARLPSPADSPCPPLAHAMIDTLLKGGKRFRPYLLMQSARLCDCDDDAAWRVAVALECIHAYSLVHDDLPCMDDSPLRHGLPTTHITYGEGNAVLVGDALLTLGLEIAASAISQQSQASPNIVIELARAAGLNGMVGGQWYDLASANEGSDSQSVSVAAIQRMKTGALIAFAARAGAILGNQPTAEEHLAAYGIALGEAYQLTDDLFDAEAEASVVGKPVGSDSVQGKRTSVGVFGIEATRQRARDCEIAAITAVQKIPARTQSQQTALDNLIGLAEFATTRGT